MSERKVFCEECRNDVAFTINEKKMEGVVTGDKYSYIGKEAHCVDCGSKVYVAEVNDYNLKALYYAYRDFEEPKTKGFLGLFYSFIKKRRL